MWADLSKMNRDNLQGGFGMRMHSSLSMAVLFCSVFAVGVFAANFEPTDIQQPGTQPGEVSNLESPDKCDNCHGGYNQSVEPAYNWRGSMMSNAGRDPIFWATLAIAEQDFDGSGDLCIRCHSTGGWYAGRSVPTDGSGLAAADSDGVDCDTCHKMTNPDDTEYQGVMFPPYIANDGNEGYYGSGMLSLWGGADKLGPYSDAQARHQFKQSSFHRSVDFCGSCHDVSNAVVGDLAPNNGTQTTADPVTASGLPGGPVENKAAFNNPPYMYGIVERTFSEYKSGALPKTLVSSYPTLPAELKAGAIKAAYESATASGGNGNYADGTERFFSCQTCHLRPVNGPGCNKKGVPSRDDLPLHDMTGGNYWAADAIVYQNNNGLLRLGGNMTALQIDAITAGKTRAMKQLSEATTLSVNGNTVHLVNLAGHKLISGYPEGRRMWLNIEWYDNSGIMLREDGAYEPVATITNPADGSPVQVQSLHDLHDPNTKVYETHYGMTQEWAAALVDLGYPTGMPLTFDRETTSVAQTLGQLASGELGPEFETFHFVLNNTVIKDNRIPPYGFSYDEARKRNALPVPAEQYGNPGTGGNYEHFDDVVLNPPAGASYANIRLLYQPVSWEYILFLWKANNGSNAFLAAEGQNMLVAWLNTGMAEPYVMAATTWGSAPTPATPYMYTDSLSTWSVSKQGTLTTETSIFNVRDTVAIKASIVEESLGAPVPGAQVFMNVEAANGTLTTTLQGFTDENGETVLRWKTGRNEAAGSYTATVTSILHNSFDFDNGSGQTTVSFTLQ